MADNSRYRKGIWSERLAAFFLLIKGYRILVMRYKTTVGEIDIVARRGRTLVFCEVKYRQSYEGGVLSITEASQARIRRAAECYIARYNSKEPTDIRFDAMIISPPFYIKHLVNAWTS